MEKGVKENTYEYRSIFQRPRVVRRPAISREEKIALNLLVVDPASPESVKFVFHLP